CLKGDKINLASGEQRRDFVYIDDVIEAYLLAAKNSNLRGEMVNIGSGIQYSVNDVVSKIIEVTGKKVRVEKNSYQPRSWDSDYWVANRRLAKKILRWEPEYNLDQGLEKTIKWFLTK
ncbi:GDP-mannose 4,6-dehydratase, partial [Patescibacteria group bacterium]|nr:GDP-mannose 4,6-dehydratase [Patescibacteria group bacterium]